MNIHTIKFIFQKNLPEIMEGVGIAGGIIATVLACKATLHVEEELDRIKGNAELVKAVPEEEGINTGRELTKVYIKGATKIARLYAPAVAVGTISVGSILYSHHILKSRNMAMAAAYALVDESYKTYRERVAEKFGKDVEKEILYGLDKKDIEYVEVTEEGKEKKRSKKNAAVGKHGNCSPYAREFNEGCINWSKSAERNLYFLRMMQADANDALHSRGHLFLNEVYDMLGFPRTMEGQIVGWKRGGSDVDFCIYDFFKDGFSDNQDFVNGYIPVCMLDFNVDGVIYDKI